MHLKNVGPIRHCEPFYIDIHQGLLLPPLSHSACALMSTTTTTTTTTTRDREDRYGPMEWAQQIAAGTIVYIIYMTVSAVHCCLSSMYAITSYRYICLQPFTCPRSSL